MITSVWYMTISPTSQPVAGLVFPLELPDDYYTIGSYVLGSTEMDRPLASYEFDAIFGGVLITVKLTLDEVGGPPFVFIADSPAGRFYFWAVRLDHHLRYVGRSKEFPSPTTLWQMVPLDERELEQACHRFRFYFVGRTPPDLARQG